jgi:hypothetical protein
VVTTETCPQRSNDVCAVASDIVGHRSAVTDQACRACAADSTPRAVNAVTVSLAISTARTACPQHVESLLLRYLPVLQASPPSLAARTASLARATAKWLLAGRPLRDAADVARIYDEVCLPCEHREATTDADISWCRQCGCRLARTDRVFHKILLATEHCPLGKW